MIVSATMSKPVKSVVDELGKDYCKIRFFYDAEKQRYDAEFFTE